MNSLAGQSESEFFFLLYDNYPFLFIYNRFVRAIELEILLCLHVVSSYALYFVPRHVAMQ